MKKDCIQSHLFNEVKQMSKRKNKKNKNDVVIDLSSRKYMKIVKMTDEERKLVNEMYDKSFREANDRIQKKTEQYCNNLYSSIEIKINMVQKSTITYDEILDRYSYIIKKNYETEEPKESISIDSLKQIIRKRINKEYS